MPPQFYSLFYEYHLNRCRFAVMPIDCQRRRRRRSFPWQVAADSYAEGFFRAVKIWKYEFFFRFSEGVHPLPETAIASEYKNQIKSPYGRRFPAACRSAAKIPFAGLQGSSKRNIPLRPLRIEVLNPLGSPETFYRSAIRIEIWCSSCKRFGLFLVRFLKVLCVRARFSTNN